MEALLKQNSKKLNRKTVDVLGIPIDIFSYDNLGSFVKELLDGKKHYHIIFVSLADIVLSKFKRELRESIERAALVLPVSSLVCKGAKFLGRNAVPQKIFTFDFTIKLLSEIENYGKSLYLIGGSRVVLQTTEANIKGSFSGLNVVGRYAGYFDKHIENNIITAIKKSAPALVLAGDGLPGKRYWITRKNKMYNTGISLWVGDDFKIFAGKKAKPAESAGGIFFEKIGKVIKNPLKIFNGFIYILYFIMLLITKIRGM